jgi:hypothetical protein
MTLSSYNAVHRRWDHVGNLVPNFEHSEGNRPHIHGAPAPWLPVAYYDKHYEVYITIMAGKLVGLSRDEWVVPAGLATAFAAGGTVLTYTANDVTEGVIDLTTGVAVTAAVGYTSVQLRVALISRGLIDSTENAADYISSPIGVAAQCMYSWAFAITSEDISRSNFAIDAKFHNFFMQSKVAVLCDYALRLPHVPREATLEAIGAVQAGPGVIGSGDLYASATVAAMVRYSGLTNTDYLAYFADNYPVATSTEQTPISASNATLLGRLRSSPEALTQTGDYFLDREAGVFFFYVAGGAVAPAHVSGTLSYYHYQAAPTSANMSDYVSAVGDIKPGSFLECDADSNFVLATNTTFRDIMGQALTSVRHPKDYLDRVKTAYEGFGVMDQMPGTASRGLPDNVTYAGASDKELVVNLISR